MTTATLMNGTATAQAEPAKRGFPGLCCIKCGEEATISLDLDDCSTCTCSSCEDTFSLDDVKAHLAAWSALVAWVEMAPARPE